MDEIFGIKSFSELPKAVSVFIKEKGIEQLLRASKNYFIDENNIIYEPKKDMEDIMIYDSYYLKLEKIKTYLGIHHFCEFIGDEPEKEKYNAGMISLVDYKERNKIKSICDIDCTGFLKRYTYDLILFDRG